MAGYQQHDGDLTAEGIVAQVFAPDGTKIGKEFLVNTTTNGAQVYPDISISDEGNLLFTWGDASAAM